VFRTPEVHPRRVAYAMHDEDTRNRKVTVGTVETNSRAAGCATDSSQVRQVWEGGFEGGRGQLLAPTGWDCATASQLEQFSGSGVHPTRGWLPGHGAELDHECAPHFWLPGRRREFLVTARLESLRFANGGTVGGLNPLQNIAPNGPEVVTKANLTRAGSQAVEAQANVCAFFWNTLVVTKGEALACSAARVENWGDKAKGPPKDELIM